MTARPRLAVELDRNIVRLEFTCEDRYAAMRFYDQVCKGTKEGPTMLHIDVEITGAADEAPPT
jgi:hypothetical protein